MLNNIFVYRILYNILMSIVDIRAIINNNIRNLNAILRDDNFDNNTKINNIINTRDINNKWYNEIHRMEHRAMSILREIIDVYKFLYNNVFNKIRNKSLYRERQYFTINGIKFYIDIKNNRNNIEVYIRYGNSSFHNRYEKNSHSVISIKSDVNIFFENIVSRYLR